MHEGESRLQTSLSQEALNFLNQLVQPELITQEQKDILDKLKKQYPVPLSTSIVIGRFQPFHPGHLFLLRCAQAVSQKFAIGMGSVNRSDLNNPFPFSFREQLVRRAIEKAGISVYKIVPLNDYPDDNALWLQQIRDQVGPVEAVIGNNPRVNGIFRDAKHRVVEIPFMDREHLEGTTIREDMRKRGFLP